MYVARTHGESAVGEVEKTNESVAGFALRNLLARLTEARGGEGQRKEYRESEESPLVAFARHITCSRPSVAISRKFSRDSRIPFSSGVRGNPENAV